MKTRLNLVVLRVADLRTSARFYQAIGLSFAEHRHGTGPLHLAAESDGFVLELYLATVEQPVTTSARVGFVTDNLDLVLSQVDATAVVAAAKDSPWGRRAVLRDPDGHKVELVQVT
jgi:catechol 2,3-dioxygenase-like lactoylglutathione lyase family enzyme